MPNFGIPSYAERLMAAERVLAKSTPDSLQLDAIKEQTTVIKQNAEKIEILNKQVSDLQQQLKEESENNAKALKKEHQFALKCGLLCATFGGIFGWLLSNLSMIFKFLARLL